MDRPDEFFEGVDSEEASSDAQDSQDAQDISAMMEMRKQLDNEVVQTRVDTLLLYAKMIRDRAKAVGFDDEEAFELAAMAWNLAIHDVGGF